MKKKFFKSMCWVSALFFIFNARSYVATLKKFPIENATTENWLIFFLFLSFPVLILLAFAYFWRKAEACEPKETSSKEEPEEW